MAGNRACFALWSSLWIYTYSMNVWRICMDYEVGWSAYYFRLAAVSWTVVSGGAGISGEIVWISAGPLLGWLCRAAVSWGLLSLIQSLFTLREEELPEERSQQRGENEQVNSLIGWMLLCDCWFSSKNVLPEHIIRYVAAHLPLAHNSRVNVNVIFVIFIKTGTNINRNN